MYTKNELLFPYHVITDLRNTREQAWRTLVNDILTLPEGHERSLALCLMMIRLNGCMGCETDSFRAMRGCKACAVQTLRRFKGTDQELINLYQSALADMQSYLAKTGKTKADSTASA